MMKRPTETKDFDQRKTNSAYSLQPIQLLNLPEKTDNSNQ